MTTTTHTPVPAAVLLSHAIVKAKVAAERATADAAAAYAWAETARANVAKLEAEYRAIRVEHVA
jgi:hypothetical protein